MSEATPFQVNVFRGCFLGLRHPRSQVRGLSHRPHLFVDDSGKDFMTSDFVPWGSLARGLGFHYALRRSYCSLLLFGAVSDLEFAVLTSS